MKFLKASAQRPLKGRDIVKKLHKGVGGWGMGGWRVVGGRRSWKGRSVENEDGKKGKVKNAR